MPGCYPSKYCRKRRSLQCHNAPRHINTACDRRGNNCASAFTTPPEREPLPLDPDDDELDEDEEPEKRPEEPDDPMHDDPEIPHAPDEPADEPPPPLEPDDDPGPPEPEPSSAPTHVCSSAIPGVYTTDELRYT